MNRMFGYPTTFGQGQSVVYKTIVTDFISFKMGFSRLPILSRILTPSLNQPVLPASPRITIMIGQLAVVMSSSGRGLLR